MAIRSIKVLLSLCMVFLMSCKHDIYQAPPQNTKLLGKITSLQLPKLFLKGIDSREIAVKSSGDFDVTFPLTYSGIYTFGDGENSINVFIKPGDSISIVGDTRALQSKVIFKGSNEMENNFLLLFAQSKDEILKQDFFSLYAMPYDSFTLIADERDDALTEKVQGFQKKNGTFNEVFSGLLMKDIAFENAKLRLSYPINKRIIMEDSLNLPETYESFLQNLELDNFENFLVPSFEECLLMYLDYRWLISKDTVENRLLWKWEEISKEFSDARVKDYLYHQIFNEAIDSDFEALAALMPEYRDFQKNEQYLVSDQKKYDEISHLLRGNQAPNIAYKDINGASWDLNSYTDRYIYVDVWATWCAPCVKEIPHLEKLKEALTRKNIMFVSISLDDQQKVWKTFIQQKKIGGIQLLAPEAWDARIVKDYAIQSIPRFIIIGPSGKIINANAPRPSDARIKKILEFYL